MLNHFKKYLQHVAAVLVVIPFSVHAAPKTIEKFDGKTWQQFQTTLSRPSIVVFSTTDCAHCPAVIEKMAAEIKQRKVRAALLVVLMDGDGNKALLRDPHYQKVNRMFEFSGQTSALQYAVDPTWRGVSPYVALFSKTGPPKLIAGNPSVADVEFLFKDPK